MSHAEFLRDAWLSHDPDAEEHTVALVRALVDAGARAAALPQAEGVQLVEARLGTLVLRPGDAEILAYTARLVLAPRTMTAAHLGPLRASGLTDAEIHDVANVVCCFSYMNRLADGLGVVQQDPRSDWAVRLLGADALAAHHAWGQGDDRDPADR